MKKLRLVCGFVAMVMGFFMLTGYQRCSAKENSNTITATYTLKEGKTQLSQKKVTLKKNDKVITGMKKVWKVKESKGFITSINGKQQNEKKNLYWTYTINGKSAEKLATKQIVHNHDQIQFTLDKVEN